MICVMTRSDSPSETTAPSSEVGSAAAPKTRVSPEVASTRSLAANAAAAAVNETTPTTSATFNPFSIVLLSRASRRAQ